MGVLTGVFWPNPFCGWAQRSGQRASWKDRAAPGQGPHRPQKGHGGKVAGEGDGRLVLGPGGTHRLGEGDAGDSAVKEASAQDVQCVQGDRVPDAYMWG